MLANGISRYGFYIALYATVWVLLWIGAFKFHPDEAQAISGLVENSPLFSWMYNIFSINIASIFIGTTEIIIAILMAMYPFNKKASLIGGLLGIGTFSATTTFLFTTPGVLHSSGIFPSSLGSFLVKDIAFIGISLMVVGNSLANMRQRSVVTDETYEAEIVSNDAENADNTDGDPVEIRFKK